MILFVLWSTVTLLSFRASVSDTQSVRGSSLQDPEPSITRFDPGGDVRPPWVDELKQEILMALENFESPTDKKTAALQRAAEKVPSECSWQTKFEVDKPAGQEETPTFTPESIAKIMQNTKARAREKFFLQNSREVCEAFRNEKYNHSAKPLVFTIVAGRNEGSDENVLAHEFLGLLKSIIMLSSRPVELNIATDEKSASFFNELKETVEMRHARISVKWNIRTVAKQQIVLWRDSANCYGELVENHNLEFGKAKLMLPRLFPGVEKAIYIDTDAVFVQDPADLWDLCEEGPEEELLRMMFDPLCSCTMFLYLERIRNLALVEPDLWEGAKDWEGLMAWTLHEMTEKTGVQLESRGDQRVFSSFAKIPGHPNLVGKLPPRWNRDLCHLYDGVPYHVTQAAVYHDNCQRGKPDHWARQMFNTLPLSCLMSSAAVEAQRIGTGSERRIGETAQCESIEFVPLEKKQEGKEGERGGEREVPSQQGPRRRIALMVCGQMVRLLPIFIDTTMRNLVGPLLLKGWDVDIFLVLSDGNEYSDAAVRFSEGHLSKVQKTLEKVDVKLLDLRDRFRGAAWAATADAASLAANPTAEKTETGVSSLVFIGLTHEEDPDAILSRYYGTKYTAAEMCPKGTCRKDWKGPSVQGTIKHMANMKKALEVIRCYEKVKDLEYQIGIRTRTDNVHFHPVDPHVLTQVGASEVIVPDCLAYPGVDEDNTPTSEVARQDSMNDKFAVFGRNAFDHYMHPLVAARKHVQRGDFRNAEVMLRKGLEEAGMTVAFRHPRFFGYMSHVLDRGLGDSCHLEDPDPTSCAFCIRKACATGSFQKNQPKDEEMRNKLESDQLLCN
uniref:Nucleotide-diphospho-sugar transferase domain-containing protein n=1 Tax=Chromera velia CCMP2878 TaxID=1169474 RepID=A0A0G4F782_9ALVE|eukprot:Cvel_15383.t1-p1 / transcript=Cvel_15383.t1 / gene=Cvel_15383 / organism=Chromera_velia_CCMP2878 / gene_product=hypothetical protein / transcript_product=hypothetical protein / location=Cvel_scaffold1135:36443-40364(-) / protein_length=839 / sequence_SO=supercontig / SO=protein_coding / is_pseudo=false